MKFNTVEEALDELRAGKIILVTDDEDRENEGDFICAAEFATTENINFMADARQGSDMHADVAGICKEASFSADGAGKYRQS